jgi:hypothetical protein
MLLVFLSLQMNSETSLRGHVRVLTNNYEVTIHDNLPPHLILRGSFEKFVDSPCYSESKLCRGAVTASDALLTTLHPLLENVLQTVDHFEISCLEAPFLWSEKPRYRMGAISRLYGRCSRVLNELCFWTLSIVWCLKNKQN